MDRGQFFDYALSPVIDKLQGCDTEQWIAEEYSYLATTQLRDCRRSKGSLILAVEVWDGDNAEGWLRKLRTGIRGWGVGVEDP